MRSITVLLTASVCSLAFLSSCVPSSRQAARQVGKLGKAAVRQGDDLGEGVGKAVGKAVTRNFDGPLASESSEAVEQAAHKKVRSLPSGELEEVCAIVPQALIYYDEPNDLYVSELGELYKAVIDDVKESSPRLLNENVPDLEAIVRYATDHAIEEVCGEVF